MVSLRHLVEDVKGSLLVEVCDFTLQVSGKFR